MAPSLSLQHGLPDTGIQVYCRNLNAGSSNSRTIGWGVSTSPDATAKAIWVFEVMQVLVLVEIEDALDSAVRILGGSCPPRKKVMALIAAASCRLSYNPGRDRLKLVHALLTPISKVAIMARVMSHALQAPSPAADWLVEHWVWSACTNARCSPASPPHLHRTPRRQ